MQVSVNTLYQLLTHLLYPTLESVKDDPLLRWLYLLDVGYKNDHEMEVLSNMTEGMRTFAKRYKVSLDDPELRRMYDYEMSAKRDMTSREYNAEMRAYEKAVRGMLNNGIPVDVIYKCVDASRADVDAIIAKVQSEN